MTEYLSSGIQWIALFDAFRPLRDFGHKAIVN
ncbi:Uncharacterised protein [Vibrio cholerae]|nr:Uncharacterised protein [Vibrio cholerae]